MPRPGPFRCAGTEFVDTDDAAISVAHEDENYIHYGLQVAVLEDINGNDVRPRRPVTIVSRHRSANLHNLHLRCRVRTTPDPVSSPTGYEYPFSGKGVPTSLDGRTLPEIKIADGQVATMDPDVTIMEFRLPDGTAYPQTIVVDGVPTTASEWELIVDPDDPQSFLWIPIDE